MLVEIKKLRVINEGYKRTISLDKIYINSDHIISVSDFTGVKELLLTEGNDRIANERFCIVKVSNAFDVEDMIVLGSSEDLYSKFNNKSEKGILNG